MGIMKSLGEMGEGMKSRLNAMASEFSRRTNSGYAPVATERKPLIGRDGEDDEEEDEEINFSDNQPLASRKKIE
jgi:hypothetical protein